MVKHSITFIAVFCIAFLIGAELFSYEEYVSRARISGVVLILLVFAVFLLIDFMYFPLPRKQRKTIVAERGLTKAEEKTFQPTNYYRMVRRRGWRNVEIEIDEAIEKPGAEIVPVQKIVPNNLGGFSPRSWPVVFEYRGQFFLWF